MLRYFYNYVYENCVDKGSHPREVLRTALKEFLSWDPSGPTNRAKSVVLLQLSTTIECEDENEGVHSPNGRVAERP